MCGGSSVADDDLRRDGVELDARRRRLGRDRRARPLAVRSDVRRLRRAAAVPHALRARRPRPRTSGAGSCSTALFYQGDVWLDGAYLGDTEGYFFPHAFEVTELSRLGRRAPARRRGGVLAPGGDRRTGATSPACSSTGDCIDPDVEPRRALAPGAHRVHGAGADRPPARAVPRRQRARAPTSASTAGSTASRPAPCTVHTFVDGEPVAASRALPGPRANERGLERGHRGAPAVVAVVARRPAAARRPVEVLVDGERSDSRDGPHRPAPGRDARLEAVGQRRAALPQGRQPAADPPGPRRGHARRSWPATSCWPARPASTSCACTAHVARPELYDAADRPGCCSGRTSRCSGARPQRSAAAAVDRRRRRCTCSVTTPRRRVVRHNSPDGERTTGLLAFAASPAAAVLEPHGPRPRRPAARSSAPTTPAP